jgi:putative ABC transport system permease protein
MSQSRPMFWRIVRRLIAANRGRLIVVLLALGAGAAVTAALLNLQVDAKQRLTNEFRAFGANVVVAPRDASSSLSSTIPETMDNRIPSTNDGSEVTKIDSLYLLVHASHVPRPPQPKNPYPQLAPTNATSDLQNAGVNNLPYEGAESATQSSSSIPVVVVGYAGRNAQHIWPSQIQEGAGRHEDCRVGKNAAKTLDVHAGDYLSLHNGTTKHICLVSTVEDFGSAEDNQIFMNLFSAQQLAFVGHDEKLTNGPQISLIQLSVPGTPQSVEKYIAELQKQIPEADVHGIRQFTESEGKIYERISGLLNATVLVVLMLTTLCVMAAMTNVAMERKNDVGLMKAIGGATRRVLRLFLAEAATLGLIAGLIGAAAGLALSVVLGKAVFGVAAQPRLIVYPVVVALTIAVAVAGAYPLRRLAGIRPASIFRGEA